LTSEIDKLRSRLREEITRTQANVRLDLNLEKGRIREESSVHELKIKETDTRIETELSQARTQLEAVKFSTLQWLIGVCTGTSAILLGEFSRFPPVFFLSFCPSRKNLAKKCFYFLVLDYGEWREYVC